MTKAKKIFRIVVFLLWLIAAAVIFFCVEDANERNEMIAYAFTIGGLPFFIVGFRLGWRLTEGLRALGESYGGGAIGIMFLISAIAGLITMEFSLVIAFLQAIFTRAEEV